MRRTLLPGSGRASKTGLELPDFPALNPAARVWLETVANVRRHREPRRWPVDLWAEERPHLQAVNPRSFEHHLDIEDPDHPKALVAQRHHARDAQVLKPAFLVVDDLGYLPIDKFGADTVFQVISQRYERGSTLIASNGSFKRWAEIFNNDSTLTSALLDRLLHHAESIVIEGRSCRMRDQIDA